MYFEAQEIYHLLISYIHLDGTLQTNLQDGISPPLQIKYIFPSSQKIKRALALLHYWLVWLVI